MPVLIYFDPPRQPAFPPLCILYVCLIHKSILNTSRREWWPSIRILIVLMFKSAG